MRPVSRCVALGLSLTLLYGCGGHGGSSSSSPALSVTSDWTNAASVGAQSAKYDLYDSHDALKQELIAGVAASPTVSPFAGVSPGTYHLNATLWSGPSGGGTVVGSFDTFVDLSSSQSLRFDVGSAVSSLVVSPPTASLQTGTSQQFFACPKDAAGNFTFGATGAATWSSLGPQVSINSSTGVALGQSVGTGCPIRATYTGGAPIGGAVCNVSAFAPQHSAWTVFVFLSSANDLQPYSIANVLQMQKVADNPANLRIVVQWKQAVLPSESPNPTFVGTRRYLISPSTGNAVASQLIEDLGTGVDMGAPQTMADFLSWGQAHYPADRYAVVCWSHGNGWAPSKLLATPPQTRGFSYDDEAGTFISIDQMTQAMGGFKPDILAWDCCNMQQIETAYEMRNLCKYMVGSESATPAAGYPYDLVFKNFRDRPTDTTPNLCQSFIDGMKTYYANFPSNEVTQSVIDESQVGPLVTATSDLADALVANSSSVSALIPYIRTNSDKYDDNTGVGRLYRDPYQVAALLQSGGGGNSPAPTAVQTAAQEVQAAWPAAVIREGHNAFFSQPHGLTISFYDTSTYQTFKASYAKLAFASASHWPSWLNVSP